ncbi:MAG: hypothetical protein R3F30_14585 [Planctomycetota bacterium]
MLHPTKLCASLVLSLLTLLSATACNGEGGAKSPRWGTIPAMQASTGSTFVFDAAPYLEDDTATAQFEVIDGGGSFTGSVYQHDFPGLGTYEVWIRATDFRGKAGTTRIVVRVTATQLAVVRSGSGVYLWDTRTGKYTLALGDNGTARTFEAGLTDGSQVYEFDQFGQKDLFFHQPSTPETRTIADESTVDEVYAGKTADDMVLYVRGTAPTRSVWLWDPRTGYGFRVTAGPAAGPQPRDEAAPVVASGNRLYFESGSAGSMDVYRMDLDTRTVTAVSTDAADERIQGVLPDGAVVFSRVGTGGEIDLYYHRPDVGTTEIGADLTDKTVPTDPYDWDKTFKGANASSQVVFEGSDGSDTDVYFWDPTTEVTTPIRTTTPDPDLFVGITATGKVVVKEVNGATDHDVFLFSPATLSSATVSTGLAAVSLEGNLSNGDFVLTSDDLAGNRDLYLGTDAGGIATISANAADDAFGAVASDDAVAFTRSGDVFRFASAAATNLTGGLTGACSFAGLGGGGDLVIAEVNGADTDLHLWDASLPGIVTITAGTGVNTWQAAADGGKQLFIRLATGETNTDLWVWDPAGPTTTQVSTTPTVDELVLAVIDALVTN